MKKHILTALILFAVGATVYAAPGEYWEVTNKMEMPGMPFAMPATTSKVCIGKGQESDPSKSSNDKKCEMTDLKRSGNKTTWKVRCDHDGEIMTGNGEQTTTANGYEGKMQFSGKSHGRDNNMSMAFSGKRIGGSCDTEEAGKKIRAQICDTSHFNSSADWVGSAEMFLNKGTACPEQGRQLCEHVRKDAPRDAATYNALVNHDKMNGAQVNVARECHLDMDAITQSVCKTLNESSYEQLAGYCPAEAKVFREAQRRKECEGRSYTAATRTEDLKKCLSGQSSFVGRSYTANDNAKNDSSSSDLSTKDVLDGAKKLKGLLGF